jgi:hypothetical protein
VFANIDKCLDSGYCILLVVPVVVVNFFLDSREPVVTMLSIAGRVAGISLLL